MNNTNALHMSKPRSPSLAVVAVLALIAMLALSGCAGHARRATAPPSPKLPRALAQGLAQDGELAAARIDAGEECGALLAAHDLQQRAISAINARQVPAALQEPLMAAANRLVGEIRCIPASRPSKNDEHGKGKQKHDNQQQGGGD